MTVVEKYREEYQEDQAEGCFIHKKNLHERTAEEDPCNAQNSSKNNI